MPEVPHDTAVGLRLELGRERDRADAFEAALRKEVLVVIADAAKPKAEKLDGADIHTWQLRSDNWQKFCQLHIDEIARLKKEIERLSKDRA